MNRKYFRYMCMVLIQVHFIFFTNFNIDFIHLLDMDVAYFYHL